MSTIEDGGSAFPQFTTERSRMGDEGMTLCDWFAGQAIAGGIARTTMPEYELGVIFGKHRTGITREEILAADAYRIADAMIALRAKRERAR